MSKILRYIDSILCIVSVSTLSRLAWMLVKAYILLSASAILSASDDCFNVVLENKASFS